jgi:pSer/pThr/pTyr-binding forkhead associated (FHA) protein
MGLYLEITDGEQSGAQFALSGGLIIGRRNSDIIIRDSKVSGQHAKIESRAKGALVLVDLESANGIKVAGKRRSEVLLTRGVELVLGRTKLRVIEVNVPALPEDAAKSASDKGPAKQIEKMAAKLSEKISEQIAKNLPGKAFQKALGKHHKKAPGISKGAPAADEILLKSVPKPGPKSRPKPPAEPISHNAPEIVIEPESVTTWQDDVRALAVRALDEARLTARAVGAFDPPLRLKFIRGIQTGVVWTLGYGPREVGLASVDLILEEPGLPPCSFRLTPNEYNVVLNCNPAANVKLNGDPCEAEFLQDGDVIEIANTQIAVSFEISTPQPGESDE